MVFKLETDTDFFQWLRWQRVLQDWLTAVEADALLLDARSVRMLATMTIGKELLLQVVTLAGAAVYEGPRLSWRQLLWYITEVLHFTQHDLRRGLQVMKQGV